MTSSTNSSCDQYNGSTNAVNKRKNAFDNSLSNLSSIKIKLDDLKVVFVN